MVALAKIILQFVDNNSPADNRQFASKSDHRIRVSDVDNARGVGLDVTQITNVTHLMVGTTVINLKFTKDLLI